MCTQFPVQHSAFCQKCYSKIRLVCQNPARMDRQLHHAFPFEQPANLAAVPLRVEHVSEPEPRTNPQGPNDLGVTTRTQPKQARANTQATRHAAASCKDGQRLKRPMTQQRNNATTQQQTTNDKPVACSPFRPPHCLHVSKFYSGWKFENRKLKIEN